MLGWFEDPQWTYLKVIGPDRVDFFHRLTTNRVPQTGEPLLHSFFLSVNARIIAELWVGADEESLSLFLPSAQCQAAKDNIERYHFSEKFELLEPDGRLFVVLDAPPEELEELAKLCAYTAKPDPRYGSQATWLFVEPSNLGALLEKLESSGPALAKEASHTLRLATGRPQFGLDYTEDTLFLEMAQEGDFSEHKGCYPGQEIVARVLHRGRLNRHLRAFKSTQSIPPGWTFHRDGKEMARVTTSVSNPHGSQGLIYVRREVGNDGSELAGVDAEGQALTLTVCARPGELPSGDDA